MKLGVPTDPPRPTPPPSPLCSAPQCQNRPIGGSLVPAGPEDWFQRHPGPRFSIPASSSFFLFVFCQKMPPPSPPLPPQAVQPEPAGVLILPSLVLMLSFHHFILCEQKGGRRHCGRWKRSVGLVFLFLLVLNVCLNSSAQSAYVLMLLLPCCIQGGHIDPQISPELISPNPPIH